MADLTPQERLQPALLDRLTDVEPGNQHEPRERRVLSKVRLRQAVLRDLQWLFNATATARQGKWEGHPSVLGSVINYGLPPLSGNLASSIDISDLERAIRNAILAFEPRILSSTLRVSAVPSDEDLDRYNVVNVQIEGQLWAQPVPLELLLRTQVDLETGQIEIADFSRSGAA
jgi:type VI secretion system protein ImpF